MTASKLIQPSARHPQRNQLGHGLEQSAGSGDLRSIVTCVPLIHVAATRLAAFRPCSSPVVQTDGKWLDRDGEVMVVQTVRHWDTERLMMVADRTCPVYLTLRVMSPCNFHFRRRRQLDERPGKPHGAAPSACRRVARPAGECQPQ